MLRKGLFDPQHELTNQALKALRFDELVGASMSELMRDTDDWLYNATVVKLWTALPEMEQEELLRLVTKAAKDMGNPSLLPDV